MKELLDAYPVIIEIPIAWGDMDAFQHVNNTVYFRHFESARIAYFEKIEAMQVMEETGVGPILAATNCVYKIPLTYPDTVFVGARVDRIEEDRFTMSYATVSNKHGKLAASGTGAIVTFDYRKGCKAPVPEEIIVRIHSLENGLEGGFSEPRVGIERETIHIHPL
jgi:acyl-CoA thioester hydrolase